MNIYVGLERFREVINIRSEDKYEAWLRYYQDYLEVFDAIFRTNYFAD
ncbi:hypothetical protein [Bacillus sp. FJAT-27445]|nr:hypothetical protein [Bacillus sp. FJAT-27445]